MKRVHFFLREVYPNVLFLNIVSDVVTQQVLRELILSDVDSLAGDVANEACERFVEPDIVEPLHSDHIAEPLVSKFMLDDHIEENDFACLHLVHSFVC